ncbi:MAG: DUF2254 domain-containing protein, partial [Flavisolibacter sp.]|nr:DUF2254 domain-containing protein [Flavisolibacter sp.]
DTIATVAECVRTEEQRNTLLRHAALVERSSHVGLPETTDREIVTDRYHTVLRLLDRREQKVL